MEKYMTENILLYIFSPKWFKRKLGKGQVLCNTIPRHDLWVEQRIEQKEEKNIIFVDILEITAKFFNEKIELGIRDLGNSFAKKNREKFKHQSEPNTIFEEEVHLQHFTFIGEKDTVKSAEVYGDYFKNLFWHGWVIFLGEASRDEDEFFFEIWFYILIFYIPWMSTTDVISSFYHFKKTNVFFENKVS